jgi:hypothetical protein
VFRKSRSLNNLTSNHVVTTAVDSRGVAEPPVSVASIRLKVLRFDIDLRAHYFLAIRLICGTCGIRFGKGIRNARLSLQVILL